MELAKIVRKAIRVLAMPALFVLVADERLAAGAPGALEMRDGYFWDPGTGRMFLPRGPAYQIWNPPVFANQSFEQVAYDLRQFSKLRANSIRAELVWGELEVADDVYDWRRADFLVSKAEELDLKLFMLIGYQYPPSWFPEEERGINDRGDRSDVLNYESAEAQQAYAEHITAVVSRYRESPAIGAWIIGNEFAYFDLWEDISLYPARRMLGYDARSLAAYREWLERTYAGDIESLNSNWGSAYTNFDDVEMPSSYPEDRLDAGYHDLIQWRKHSIAKFLALGAKAAKDHDPNHLVSYSMVGGILTGRDANNTCEDPETIVRHCVEAGAPLDFWAVNNYAWATDGAELRSLDFGIAKYQDRIGLPVMLSETGHTSTEEFNAEASDRQAQVLPTSLWECLGSGAVGIHFFHWNDRNNFTPDYFLRERGFGIVNQDRTSKGAVYDNVEDMFLRLEEIDIENLLARSRDPDPEILIYLTPEGDMGFPRANQEHTMLAGVLRRLGYQVGLIGPEDLAAGRYGTARALVLSRSERLEQWVLPHILQSVLPAGIHVHAEADLPGRIDAYGRPHPGWAKHCESIFGVDVSDASAVWAGGVTQRGGETYRPLIINGTDGFGSLPADFHEELLTWKIWTGVRPVDGATILEHRLEDGAPPSCALQILEHDAARAALNTFATADTHPTGASTGADIWDVRSDLMGAIYRDFFGIVPKIRLEGPKAQYVFSDYRICRNGSVLISLLNGHVGPVQFTLHAPELIGGKTVELLSDGGILSENSNGSLDLSLEGDDYILLYVYDENGPDRSLLDRSPYRVWWESAPQVVWPSVAGVDTVVGFETRGTELDLVLALESATHPHQTYLRSAPVTVAGQGTSGRNLVLRDADLNDLAYRSTPDGGSYLLRASLEKDGVTVAESAIPVRLVWGVRPLALPEEVPAGNTYEVDLEWEELAGYLPGEAPTSIDRAALFSSLGATEGQGADVLAQHYNVVLELRDQTEQVVGSAVHVTREATGSATMRIDVPVDARQPFHWFAYTETSSDATSDVMQSFEGWQTGEAVPFNPRTAKLGPTEAGQATYSGRLALPISPGSSVVEADVNGTLRQLRDDGTGVLEGVGGDTGTINYLDGSITVTFGTPPTEGGNDITVSYQVGIPRPEITLPWEFYTYTEQQLPVVDPADPGSPPIQPFYLNHGIHIEGFHGAHSVFSVLDNHAGVGVFSGFGLRRVLDDGRDVSDPTMRNATVFSYSFREDAEIAGSCRLELQVKDTQEPPGVLLFAKDYAPDEGGWDTVSARLDQFEAPPWSPQPEFDYTRVGELICNVALLATDRFFLTSLDDIRFDGPERIMRGGSIDAFYDSRNDSPEDQDGDGLADRYESGTGIYVGPTDTGTDAGEWDTDGDGQSDGAEVVAGSDPNASWERFEIEVVRGAGDTVSIHWNALTGRRYVVETCEFQDGADEFSFHPLPSVAPVEVSQDGPVSVTLERRDIGAVRLYRVVGWMKAGG